MFRKLDIDPRKSRSCIAIGALTKHDYSRRLRKDLIFIHFDITSRRQNKKKRLLVSITKDCKSVKMLTIHTTFETWRTRMQKRIESSPSKIPMNKAVEIYNLSRYIHFFAKMKYYSLYKSWSEYIIGIDLKVQLAVNDKEIPFKENLRKID